MPYDTTNQLPDSVKSKYRGGRLRQFMEVFNSAYSKAVKDGQSHKEAEQSAFAQAHSVAGEPNRKRS